MLCINQNIFGVSRKIYWPSCFRDIVLNNDDEQKEEEKEEERGELSETCDCIIVKSRIWSKSVVDTNEEDTDADADKDFSA